MEDNLLFEYDPYRLKFHLMPPTGWLNDPNGLCQLDGTYHVFFQYAPDSADGKGDKYWGHYESTDLIDWKYTGIAVSPDQEIDRNGAYSGSALVEDGQMYVYYTGNVKLPGNHDYTTSGRLSNTILIQSKDGIHFTEKKVVVDNNQYPDKYSCHIRDPKVWKHRDLYYMILGARTKDDRGAVILYTSKDKENWNFLKEITTREKFGYMWECPDLFMVNSKLVLSISPQGLPRGNFENQNIYQSGYFILNYTVDQVFDADTEIEDLGVFTEWDMGFDFYAPQTFRDEYGRRLLIGWAGLPDIEAEYQNPSVEYGWQHTLTLPRELSVVQIEDEDGTNSVLKVFQAPHCEFAKLRCGRYSTTESVEEGTGIRTILGAANEGTFDLVIHDICCNDIVVNISEEITLTYTDGCFELKFEEGSLAGAGRTVRKAMVPDLFDLRIIADTSMLEIYLNDGEFVFTTRYYIAESDRNIQIHMTEGGVDLWKLSAIQMTKEK